MSTEVDVFLRTMACSSIRFRMDSTGAWVRRNRLVNPLSSRSIASQRCSVSMHGEPNWEASYRAKKITQRAFSVYRSNLATAGSVYVRTMSASKGQCLRRCPVIGDPSHQHRSAPNLVCLDEPSRAHQTENTVFRI